MRDLCISGWRRTLLRLLFKLRSWILITPGLEVQLFHAQSLEWKGSGNRMAAAMRRNPAAASRAIHRSRKTGPLNRSIYVLKISQDKRRVPIADASNPGKSRKKEARRLLETVVIDNNVLRDAPCRFTINGGSKTVSIFSKQGLKSVNQDTMLVLESFAGRTDTIFCGVFDGHGPQGHVVSRIVRDSLPEKLAAIWQENFARDDACIDQPASFDSTAGDPHLITAWKESIVKAYKQMDKELLLREVDYVSSGTTAVTLVKQGNHLFLGNVGDSRAVLGVVTDSNSLMALQLTVDLKPNLPKEAERIRRYRGRIFALRTEPSVKRVWLPHANAPGLAMARSLGDFCLKKFGVISEPLITYRELSPKDKFIVLASDGVWDVLSNEQVVEIVASVPVRSLAAKAVVEVAAFLWRLRRPYSCVDDCTAVCIFLDDSSLVSEAGPDVETSNIPVQCELIIAGNDAAATNGVELIMVSDVDRNRVELLTVSCIETLPESDINI